MTKLETLSSFQLFIFFISLKLFISFVFDVTLDEF
jgi:hypothetical protein